MATPARSPLPSAIAGTYHHRPPRRWSTALALRAWGVALLLAAGCRDQGPSTGNVRVTVTTTGGDLDLDGYALTVDGAGQQSIAVSGTMLLPDLPTGPHDVELIGVAANCTVAGPNPRLVAVRGGAVVEVSFAVSCVATGVQVTTPTTGVEIDPDGYTVAVDGGTPQAIVVNGSATITRLSAGSHTVVLSGVAANCAVTGSAARSVSIASGQTVPVIFDVTCLATTGNIEVTAATAGIDVDADGYTVQVDAGAAQALAINGTARFEGLGAGDHSVTLAGAAGNCSVAGSNPRALSVSTGGVKRDTVRTTFQVTCVAVTGSIQVTTATSGIDLDPNGYGVQIDGGSPRSVFINGTTTIEGLSAGNHSVTLANAEANCTVAGANPRTIPVTTGGVTRDTARTTFQVTCVAVTGTIKVTAATSGIDLDPNGYTVLVDGGQLQALPLNGAAIIEGLSGGDHSVGLFGAAGNCTVAGVNPRTLHVTTGGATRDTARTTFEVTCVAVTGAVQVTTVTSGIDPDPNGYSVLLDDGQQRSLPATGSVTIEGVSAGDHNVILFAVASNCTVTGQNPQTVHVTTGSITRDTARSTFQVGCVAVQKIAFEREGTIVVVYADGSNAVTLVQGTGPTWSPDGAKIAHAAISCYDYYYYNYCYPVGLAVTGVGQLTSDPSDAQPAWSPDGTKIAFTSSRSGHPGLWVVNATGGSPTLITDNPRSVSKPAWSPNSAQLAFTCVVDTGNSDICRIDANGTGFVRLTSDLAQDAAPAWKPGGSMIAFATTRYTSGVYELAAMNPDGTGVTRVSPGTPASDPSWSPDGMKLAFADFASCGVGNCHSSGLLVMNANGTGITRLTSGADYAPAWRP